MVDDYLILFQSNCALLESDVADILHMTRDCFNPLNITHELPVDGKLRFLDLLLNFGAEHVCWRYDPRAGKPLLPFQSAHSKLVKRSVACFCVKNAVSKSCAHLMIEAVQLQSERLSQAGYPMHLQVSVAEGLLKKLVRPPQARPSNTKKKVVIPYIRKVAHNLKRIAQKSHVPTAFSAPLKLASLCRLTQPDRAVDEGVSCTKKHRAPFQDCEVGVVYSIPLSCGKRYIGQTGRCINERFREHASNVTKEQGGLLALHCKDCTCKPLLQEADVVCNHRNKYVREIIEAEMIQRLGDNCVSSASIFLSNKELQFLRSDFPS